MFLALIRTQQYHFLSEFDFQRFLKFILQGDDIHLLLINYLKILIYYLGIEGNVRAVISEYNLGLPSLFKYLQESDEFIISFNNLPYYVNQKYITI